MVSISGGEKVVAFVAEKHPEQVLDIATGTGDLAVALVASGAKKIVGLDLSPGMLALGKEKVAQKQLDHTIEMVIGDSEEIDYPNAHFDAVTVAFGVRNFEQLDRGLQEIFRVLRPGGQLVVLETSVPTKFPINKAISFTPTGLCPQLDAFSPRIMLPMAIYRNRRQIFLSALLSTIF